MQQQTFFNKKYTTAVQKIRQNHAFSIREAIDKADLSTIVDIAELTFKLALIDDQIKNELKIFFKKQLTSVVPKKIGEEYDYIMQGSVSLSDLDDAADFLAACKLFIKYSSEYSICVNHEMYTFYFNIDRVDNEELSYE